MRIENATVVSNGNPYTKSNKKETLIYTCTFESPKGTQTVTATRNVLNEKGNAQAQPAKGEVVALNIHTYTDEKGATQLGYAISMSTPTSTVASQLEALAAMGIIVTA